MDDIDVSSHSQLNPDEAWPLTAATVARAAGSITSRYLVVKGMTLTHHTLRGAYLPSDVDVMGEPRRVDELRGRLAESGWGSRAESLAQELAPHHSLCLSAVDNPADIDLHHEFPGLLAGPERAFEVLWEHREQMMVAGFPCWIPDRASSIVIWALHSLRGTHTQPRHAEELAQLVNDVLPKLSGAERLELADRIVELGADEPLRVVPEFAAIIGDRRGPQAPGALEAWLGKVAQAHEVTPWLQVLREARPAERPGLVLRAIWPSAHDLRLTDEFLVDTPLGRARSRGRRAWRLVRRFVERRRQAR